MGQTLTKPVQIFGKTATLCFGPRGRSFSVHPDDRVENITP